MISCRKIILEQSILWVINMGEMWMRVCGLFGHGETKIIWYPYKEYLHIVSRSKGEYITLCKRCGMIVNIERC
jgi:hypothetical protein